jgi:hypothetical protein
MTRIDGTNAERVEVSRLLQEGVYVAGPAEAETVSTFVCRVLNIDPSRRAADIRTILVNGRVVDDPDTAVLRGGDVLVLSGAMPGLVGAMLRSGSPLRSMRATITADNSPIPPTREGPVDFVVVKLFNTVLRDYAQALVAQGFWIAD